LASLNFSSRRAAGIFHHQRNIVTEFMR